MSQNKDVQTGATDPKKIKYTGSSLDEITFIEMCRDVGIAYFIERNQNSVRISVNGEIEVWEVMHVNEFDSDRKRMSVIAKNESNGKVFSFVKGADIAILPRLSIESKANNKVCI